MKIDVTSGQTGHADDIFHFKGHVDSSNTLISLDNLNVSDASMCPRLRRRATNCYHDIGNRFKYSFGLKILFTSS